MLNNKLLKNPSLHKLFQLISVVFLCLTTAFVQASNPSDPSPQCTQILNQEIKEACLNALQDKPKAQLQIGRYYAGQIDPNIVDYPQAFYWHRRLARLADNLKLEGPVYSETMYNTGIFYADGLGTTQNHEKAFYWFKKSANRGDDVAMFRLALIYSDGLGTPANLKESLDWLKRAVMAGNLDAKVLLAQVYSEGTLVQQDNALAIKLLRKATQKNSAKANFALGNFYLHGIEVDKSLFVAKDLFSKACQSNLLEACRAYYGIDIQEK